MSLNVYLRKERVPERFELAQDIEKLFDFTKITDTDSNRFFLKEIEQGSYNDKTSYIDRFGFKLPITEISTGCKAALCVMNNTNKTIDLLECGLNARDAVIKYCTDGHVLFRNSGLTVAGDDEKIDVVVNGHHFTTIRDFNLYVFENELNGAIVWEV